MGKKDCASLIFIMLLIEYLIFDWTYRFSSDKSVIDQLSFAGTIVGIILAVVAIFYSFLQADSQTKTSNAIAGQIGSLRDMVQEFNQSKTKFSHELDRMSDIATKLDLLDSHVGESNKAISSVHSDVAQLARQLEGLKREEGQPLPKNGSGKVEHGDNGILGKVIRASFDTFILSYSLKLSIGRNLKENDIVFNHFATPFADVAQAEAGGDVEKWKEVFSRRSSMAVLSLRIFEGVELITISEDEVITVTEKFKEIVSSINFDDIFSGSSLEKPVRAIAASFNKN